LTIILCASFIRVTDCTIRVSWSFTGGLQSPGCYTYMIVIIKMIEIYNIAAQPYYCWWTMHTASKQSYCTPTYVFIVWKEDASLPAMFNHYAAVQINNCLKRTFVIKVATMKITDDLMEAITWLPLNRHFSWWTKMNGTHGKSMMYVQRVGKRHLSGLSDIEQRKNQACSLSHALLSYASGRQLV